MKNIFSLILAICILNIGYSQTNHFCGTDEIHSQLMQSNPDYAQSIHEQNMRWAEYKSHPEEWNFSSIDRDDEVYTIPVVFHIIHSGQAIGSPKNPSDEYIEDVIDFLNKVYSACCNVSAQWSTYPDINNGGVYVPIQFVLAKRTPNCEPANGINRINGSALLDYADNGVPYYESDFDLALKDLSRWDPKYYMNIWVVTGISGNSRGGGGVAAYATYPGTSSEYDGIVVSYQYLYWALDHEIGHYLGLRHTFTGTDDENCPDNFDCTMDGDAVCDTDPHPLVTSGCPTGTNPCTGSSWVPIVYNIMNYTDCPNRFTEGQKERMMFHLLEYRSLLTQSLAINAPGEEPSIEITPEPLNACVPTGISNPDNEFDIGPRAITLANLSYNSGGYTDDGFNFYLNHTIDNSTCLQNKPPDVAYLNAGNLYTLTVSHGYYNGENTGAWIDWNNDGIFQSSEKVMDVVGSSSNSDLSYSSEIVVPENAVPCTSLRMRVFSDFYGSAAPSPCQNPAYGQVEDFIVYVESVHSQASQSICEGDELEFDGQWLSEAGSYTASFQSAGGCDSIVTLTLNIIPPLPLVAINQSICSGESYTFDEQEIYEAGEYTAVFQSSSGCDSTVTLILSIDALPEPSITQDGSTLSTQSFVSYQWLLNGEPIPGANSQSHTAVENGNYSVQVTNESGCNNSSGEIEVIVVSVENYKDADIRIFPNPSSGKFSVHSDLQIELISVYDSSGRLVLTKAPSSRVVEIDLSKYTRGNYLLKVESTEMSKSFQLILE